MKESEYIRVTNCERIRIAMECLRNTLPDEILNEKERSDIYSKLHDLYDKYSKKIKLKDDK